MHVLHMMIDCRMDCFWPDICHSLTMWLHDALEVNCCCNQMQMQMTLQCAVAAADCKMQQRKQANTQQVHMGMLLLGI